MVVLARGGDTLPHRKEHETLLLVGSRSSVYLFALTRNLSARIVVFFIFFLAFSFTVRHDITRTRVLLIILMNLFSAHETLHIREWLMLHASIKPLQNFQRNSWKMEAAAFSSCTRVSFTLMQCNLSTVLTSLLHWNCERLPTNLLIVVLQSVIR